MTVRLGTSTYPKVCNFCNLPSLGLYWSEERRAKSEYLTVIKKYLNLNFCVFHQCGVCFKKKSVKSIEKFIVEHVDSGLVLDHDEHWSYSRQIEKVLYPGHSKAISPYDVCRLYNKNDPGLCKIEKSGGNHYCSKVCSMCNHVHVEGEFRYCKDCICCVDGCANYNLRPNALFCMDHHHKLSLSLQIGRCEVCGSVGKEMKKETDHQFCLNCVCNLRICNVLLTRKDGNYCPGHACQCHNQPLKAGEKEVFYYDSFREKVHRVPKFLQDFPSLDMIDKPDKCLSSFKPCDLHECEIKGKCCRKFILRKEGEEGSFVHPTRMSKVLRRVVEKNYPLQSLLNFTRIVSCGACHLTSCKVYSCKFKVPIHNDNDLYCVFHSKAPQFCIFKHCYNQLEPLSKDPHECSWEELLRPCESCNQKFNMPLIWVQEKKWSSYNNSKIAYQILPRCCGMVFSEKTSYLFLKKEIITNLLIDRRKGVLPSSIKDLKSLHLLFSNMVLYKNHDMATQTTLLQLNLLKEKPDFDFLPSQVNLSDTAVLMLTSLPLVVALQVLTFL